MTLTTAESPAAGSRPPPAGGNLCPSPPLAAQPLPTPPAPVSRDRKSPLQKPARSAQSLPPLRPQRPQCWARLPGPSQIQVLLGPQGSGQLTPARRPGSLLGQLGWAGHREQDEEPRGARAPRVPLQNAPSTQPQTAGAETTAGLPAEGPGCRPRAAGRGWGLSALRRVRAAQSHPEDRSTLGPHPRQPKPCPAPAPRKQSTNNPNHGGWSGEPGGGPGSAPPSSCDWGFSWGLSFRSAP